MGNNTTYSVMVHKFGQKFIVQVQVLAKIKSWN